MSENGNQALKHVELCIESLKQALQHAAQANLAWQWVTGHEYARLVDHYTISGLIDATRIEAATDAILQVTSQRFPGLPCKPKDWAEQALEAEVALSQIGPWYVEQVAPTAQEDTWKHMLKKGRETLPRVGEWAEHRFEAKQSGRRLSLGVWIWTQSYGGDWRNASYDCRDRLLGLEAVIRYAMGVDFGLGGRGALYEAAKKQVQPGQDLTYWPYAPQIRTFKNGRFDIWLRDEALALKVKAILENTNPTT